MLSAYAQRRGSRLSGKTREGISQGGGRDLPLRESEQIVAQRHTVHDTRENPNVVLITPSNSLLF
jgi:hypothetical protein